MCIRDRSRFEQEPAIASRHQREEICTCGEEETADNWVSGGANRSRPLFFWRPFLRARRFHRCGDTDRQTGNWVYFEWLVAAQVGLERETRAAFSAFRAAANPPRAGGTLCRRDFLCIQEEILPFVEGEFESWAASRLRKRAATRTLEHKNALYTADVLYRPEVEVRPPPACRTIDRHAACYCLYFFCTPCSKTCVIRALRSPRPLPDDYSRATTPQVAVGENHSLALTKAGELYSWGHGDRGRLGVGTSCRVGVPDSDKSIFPTPMLLHAFSKEVVRQAR